MVAQLQVKPKDEADEDSHQDEGRDGLAGAGAVEALGLPAGAVEGAALKGVLFGFNEVAAAQAVSREVDRGGHNAGFQLVDFGFDLVFLEPHLANALF